MPQASTAGAHSIRFGTGGFRRVIYGSLFRRVDLLGQRRRIDCAQPYGPTSHLRHARLSSERKAELRRPLHKSGKNSGRDCGNSGHLSTDDARCTAGGRKKIHGKKKHKGGGRGEEKN